MLIGSANVNQRSMDGRRDTEIAIGCYQSTSEESSNNSQEIHAFRMSLWYEHIGQAAEAFEDPECPVSIANDGSVQDLPDGNGHFPDTRTPVKGKRSKLLAPVFTT